MSGPPDSAGRGRAVGARGGGRPRPRRRCDRLRPGRVIPRCVGPPETFGDGADPALQTMLIHRQAVDRSEGPRLRLLDRSAGHEALPTAGGAPPGRRRRLGRRSARAAARSRTAPDPGGVPDRGRCLRGHRPSRTASRSDDTPGRLTRRHLRQCERLDGGFKDEQSGHTSSTQARPETLSRPNRIPMILPLAQARGGAESS